MRVSMRRYNCSSQNASVPLCVLHEVIRMFVTNFLFFKYLFAEYSFMLEARAPRFSRNNCSKKFLQNPWKSLVAESNSVKFKLSRPATVKVTLPPMIFRKSKRLVTALSTCFKFLFESRNFSNPLMYSKLKIFWGARWIHYIFEMKLFFM